ncbi:adhesion G-protein coupled receptor G2-like isoform X2 [Echeneis naucrates]|uniref:adhesion G-protein coupled receptor G2-like isoform X2 n=1 Tax=Echeneis naucrates TaxID=173247 RepID=UPI001113F810|nr:adhesion G-protein coupled receptor G2-like isoform X2 [Echeneis naucrates]
MRQLMILHEKVPVELHCNLPPTITRMKKPCSNGRHLYWLQMLLVGLLAGQAYCDEISIASHPLTSAAETSAVHWFLNITVTGPNEDDSAIQDWLVRILQNNLDGCFSPTTTSPPTTSGSTSNETTLVTTAATTINTTTAEITTTVNSTNTTTASTSTTVNSTNATTATTLTTVNSTNTTAVTISTTVNRQNTTTATTSTTVSSTNTTTVATSTTFKSNNKTTLTTPTEMSTTTTETTPTALDRSTTATPIGPTTLDRSTTTTPIGPTALDRSTTATPIGPTTLDRSTTATPIGPTTLDRSTTATPIGPTALDRSTTATPIGPTALDRSTTATPIGPTTLERSTETKQRTPTTLESTIKPAATKDEKTSTQQNTRLPNNNINNNGENPPRRPSFFLSGKLRVLRQIDSSMRQNRLNTTAPFQVLEFSCTTAAVKKKKNCNIIMKLKQRVPPCCILHTICAASKNSSSDFSVVPEGAHRIYPHLEECHSATESCNYVGPTSPSCDVSAKLYVEDESNSAYCDPDQNKCNCFSYCNKIDAYYTFQISINDPSVSQSHVLSLIDELKQAPNCSSTANFSCPLAIIAAEYKDGNVYCENDTANCKVILHFGRKVPICSVLAAVTKVFQSNEQISFDGPVNRAAICGNSNSTNSLGPESMFMWSKTNLSQAELCEDIVSNLTCQKGKHVIVELNEQCVPLTTPSPNVNTTSSPLNSTTAANITTTTQSAESQANALLELTRDVSALNSSQVEALVAQLEALLSGPTVSLALGNTSVNIVSNLLGASAETLADSSNRIIGIVDTVGLKLVLEEQAETLLSPAVALSVKPVDGSNFEETFFSISDPSNVQVRGDPRLASMRTDSSIPQGSIRLPPSLTQDLTTEQQQLASRVQFNFYQKSTVFQDQAIGQRKLNSGILGASVANLSITGLRDDVIIFLRNTEPVPANYVATCVFWDFTLNNQSGGWNPNGCSVQNSTDNETVCGCNHLTSFAILLDLAREPVTSRLLATILTFITFIGCGISAIFLSVTLLTYLAFGKLRKDIPSKILIQLCTALLLLNLVFLVDAWLALYPEAVGLCISTAWFLHYFLLVSFTWMGLEAVQMYLALVKVFNSYVSSYMLKLSLVGWGVPMIVVIIVIAIDKDNYGLISYGRFTDGTSDEFCWLKNDIAFYVAVVAYFCVIFLFNFIIFIAVLVQLCRIKRQNPHNAQHRTTMQDVRTVAGITILLGLTWGFAFFAWGPVNLAFMFLFSIFNSLQGFFIFVFYCAMKENVRRQWRTYLCCGRMRLAENSEWSRTATQKTVKKASVTRLTSLHSSKSNNSSSSTFLVSDSSEQINGIGNPYDDRTITAGEDSSTDVILNEINRQQRNQ